MNLVDKVLSVASSSTEEERTNIFIELIEHYNGEDGYKQMDKDASHLRTSGQYGVFAEFLVKNICLINSHQENLYVWDGIKFYKPSSPISFTGREKKNSDYLFKTNDICYNVCSCKMTNANTERSISVSDCQINEELTKVYDVIKNDCSNPYIEGTVAVYSKFGSVKELSRRCENAGFSHVNIISMNPEVDEDTSYMNEIASCSNLTFTSFNSLWKRFIEIVVHSYHKNIQLIFQNLSNKKLKFIPRVEQEKIAKNVSDYLRNHDICGISAICRFGKTATTAYSIKMYYPENSWKGKTVTFVSYYPNNFCQQVDDFKLVFGKEHINVSEKNGKEYTHCNDKLNLIIISVQFSSREEISFSAKELISSSDFVIYDEAHIGFGSFKQQDFLSYLPKNGKTIVISATPYTSKLIDVTFFSFTDLDRLMSDVNGSLDYYHNPNVIYVNLDSIVDRETKKKYTWETCQELIHSQKKNNRALFSVLNTIIEAGYNGIDISLYIDSFRKKFSNKTLYYEEPEKRYLSNFILWCNSINDIPPLLDTCKTLQKKWKSVIDLRVKFSVSNMSSLTKYYDYYEKDALSGINQMFSCTEKDGKRVINIFICVEMNTTGCTIRNADAGIHLHDGKSYNMYEQKSGRLKERTHIKNYEELEDRFSHFTFVFDILKLRMLNCISFYVPRTSSGNVDKTSDEFKYLSSIYSYMCLDGSMSFPTPDELVNDITESSMKNLSEKLSNREYIFQMFGYTGYNGETSFELKKLKKSYDDMSSETYGEGVSFSLEDDSLLVENSLNPENKDLIKKKTNTSLERIKNLSFTCSELMKRTVPYMSKELLLKINNHEISFLDAIGEIIHDIKVERIFYDETCKATN